MSITEDKTGNIWFGTHGGASRFDGKSFTNFTTDQGLANNVVKTILEDKMGNLWFGTDCGVSRYDRNCEIPMSTYEKNNKEKERSFTNFTTLQGLANNKVLSITEDKSGNIWFGTDGGGVSRFDGNSFTTFTISNGLPDNVIPQIIVDAHENILFGTNQGIVVLKGYSPLHSERNEGIPAQNNLNNEELKKYTPVFEIYNSSKGYPVKDVNFGQNCMFSDSKGIIWIGTGSDKTALVRFDYAALNKDINPPKVILQRIKINEETICWYNLNTNKNDSIEKIQQEVMTFGKLLTDETRDNTRKKFSDIQFDGITKFYSMPENLVLPYKHNNVTFDFAAIETGRSFLVRYQYILEGYDKNWSPFIEKTSATFGNINEGSYTFKLKARSPFGVWSEPIAYKFKVLPPW